MIIFKVSSEDITIYEIGFPFFFIFIKKEIDITTKEKNLRTYSRVQKLIVA